MSDEINKSRISINLRVDMDKYTILEEMRKAGFGLAQTERNRSSVYNEVLGYGIQTDLLKKDIGERNFEKIWRLLHSVNWEKVNVEKIENWLK